MCMCVCVHILVCMSACVYVAMRDWGNIFKINSLYINRSQTAQYVEILCDQLSLHAADYIGTDSVSLYIRITIISAWQYTICQPHEIAFTNY